MTTNRRCDVCGEPATCHETVIDDGVATRRHLCSRHGDGVWIDAAPKFDLASLRFFFTHAEELRKQALDDQD